jgi:hypothetical protein
MRPVRLAGSSEVAFRITAGGDFHPAPKINVLRLADRSASAYIAASTGAFNALWRLIHA